MTDEIKRSIVKSLPKIIIMTFSLIATTIVLSCISSNITDLALLEFFIVVMTLVTGVSSIILTITLIIVIYFKVTMIPSEPVRQALEDILDEIT